MIGDAVVVDIASYTPDATCATCGTTPAMISNAVAWIYQKRSAP